MFPTIPKIVIGYINCKRTETIHLVKTYLISNQFGTRFLNYSRLFPTYIDDKKNVACKMACRRNNKIHCMFM